MSTLPSSGPTIDVEEIVLDDGRCRCGGKLSIYQLKGEPGPRCFHKNPPCNAFQSLPPLEYLAWVKTGQRPIDRHGGGPATTGASNRHARRRAASIRRKR
jgi:hypothetical protein